MSGRKILLVVVGAVVALAVVAAGGYVFVERRIQSQIEGGLRQFAANPPAPYRTVGYDKIQFTLHDRRLVITGIKAESDGGDRMSAAQVEFEGFDPDVWQQSVGPHPAGATLDAEFRRLVDRMVFTDVQTVQAGYPGSVERAVVTKVDLRPIPSDVVATLRAQSPAERIRNGLAYARIGAVTVEGVRGQPGGRALTLARAEIVGLREERFASMVLEKMDHDQPDGRFTMGRFELRDGLSAIWFSPMETKSPDEKLAYFDFTALKLADLRKQDAADKDSGATVELAEFGKIDRRRFESLTIRNFSVVDRKLSDPVAVTIGNLELKDLDWEELLPVILQQAGVTGEPRKELSKLTFSQLRYSLGKLVLSNMQFAPGITLAEMSLRLANEKGTGDVDFTASDLVVKAGELEGRKTAVALAAIGYSTLTLSMRMRASSARDSGRAGLDVLEVFGPQVGKLNARYAITNYRESPNTDPITSLLAADFDSAEVAWQDDGLTQRLLALVAQQQRTTIGHVKSVFATQIRQFAAPYLSSPRLRQVAEAALKYIDKPGSVTISAKPTRPVPVNELIGMFDAPPGGQPDLPAIADVLGLSASAR